MYKVYCDDYLIFSKNIATLQLTEAKLYLELNKTGVFSFIIYPNHKYYDRLIKMKSIVKVYQNDKLIFKGRILNEELSFYNAKQVTCEGVLAFLLDSVIRPFNFSEGINRKTPKELLEYFISEHNKSVDDYKKFKVGNVTVTDGDTTNTDNLISRSSDSYQTTWNAIQNSLVDTLGGYLYVRFEDDVTYIDYLKDFDTLSNQPIIFGKNLLDLTRNVKGENIVTAIIPTGGNSESLVKLSYGITPRELGNGFYGKEDYIYNEEAVKKYGWITTYNNWSDVTNVDNLETKAIKLLSDSSKYLTSIEIQAVDLSLVNLNYDSFSLGKKIIIQSKYHLTSEETADKKYLVDKLSIDLLNPQNSTLTISSEFKSTDGFKSYTEQNNINNNNVNKVVDEIKKKQDSITVDIDVNKIKQAVIEETNSTISQSTNEIMTEVSERFYLKDEANSLIESIDTKFSQTNNAFDFRFNAFNQDLEALVNGNEAKFNEINKYIRFINGDIVLGEEGNELTLKIQNDRISFLQDSVEVAYFSNRKMYVTDGEYKHTLQIGNFVFSPRKNGNLSFKKVK